MKQIIIHIKNGDRVEAFAAAFAGSPDKITWTQHDLPGIPNLQFLKYDEVAAIISIADPPDDAPPTS